MKSLLDLSKTGRTHRRRLSGHAAKCRFAVSLVAGGSLTAIYSPPHISWAESSCLAASSRRDESLPLAERRARGAYYTPAAVVKYIVGETLTADLWRDGPPTVLDPACGDGAFLCEVAERLVEQFGSDAARLAPRVLFGIDRDPVAVSDARRNVAMRLLGETASERRTAQLAAKLAKNIVVADALLDPLPRRWPQTFDAVVGNPPYVNIRRSRAAIRKRLRAIASVFAALSEVSICMCSSSSAPWSCCGPADAAG